MLKRLSERNKNNAHHHQQQPPLKVALSGTPLAEVGNQRLYSRSISWNASGSYLAMASSDRMTRLWNVQDVVAASSTSASTSSATLSAREIVTIAGHSGTVDRVRFHPVQESILATASGSDGTVRLWDVRGATSKAVGKIDLSQTGSAAAITAATKSKDNTKPVPGGAVDIAWSSKPGILAVTDRNGSVHVIDARKLSSATQGWVVPSDNNDAATKSKNPKNSPLLKTFSLRPSFVDACIFSPSTDYLVAATSNDGYGEITTWNWEKIETLSPGENADSDQKFVYPAHTGPIYSMEFSSDGRRLATGAGDAVVGLWDVASMACTATMTRCSRFVRSVSFSHDSQLIAVSTEDDVVDIGMSDTGAFAGSVSLSGGRNRAGGGAGGADEIAFHPKSYLLACARCDSVVHPPLTIAKLKVETS